jgi:hypothetical protein
MERDGFKFDLVTQRFFIQRWETATGKMVRDNVLAGLKCHVEIRGILDPYVLDHPENVEPYGYPYYPKDAMGAEDFWVLTNDDLRGIHFYNEDFMGSPSFEKKALTYSSFYNCNLSKVNLEMTDFSYARIEKCNLDGAVFYRSGGFSTRLTNCSAKNLLLYECAFRECDFSGTNFRGTYFEDNVLENMKVDYLTRFDLQLPKQWKKRMMPPSQKPDVLRAIRLAYERAEIWSTMDLFLSKEKTEERKEILWPLLVKERSRESATAWFSSLVSGWSSAYATAPSRVLLLSILAALAFAGAYLMLGMPVNSGDALQALYFSLTTFVSLGDGNIIYGSDRPYMRLLTTAEAWLGVVLISLFVVVLARKLFRR